MKNLFSKKNSLKFKKESFPNKLAPKFLLLICPFNWRNKKNYIEDFTVLTYLQFTNQESPYPKIATA